MAENVNFTDLIRQKRELLKQLANLAAREFAATSGGEMQMINEERRDYLAALKKINSLLDLPRYSGYTGKA